MANLTNAYDPNAEAQQDLGKLPSGEYVAQIVESDMKPTNGNTGTYLELTYVVTEGPLAGRKHWERLNLEHQSAKVVEIANRQFASLREAVGVPNPRDSAELHFKPHIIRIEFNAAGSTITSGSKKGQVRERDEATIKAWKKLEGAAPVQAPAAQQAAATASGKAPWQRSAA